MTPNQHGTTAASLLTASVPAGDVGSLVSNAKLAQVHAILSRASGSGSEYTAAETALGVCASEPWSFESAIELARAHALLAATS